MPGIGRRSGPTSAIVTAGKNAAAYIKEGKTADAKTVEILPVDGVRYTVPKYIRPTEMEDILTVRFRVAFDFYNFFTIHCHCESASQRTADTG